MIKEDGRMGTLKHWIESLQENFGNDLIPYEWVSDYVMVSRVALMKRVKKEQLQFFHSGYWKPKTHYLEEQN